MDLMTLRASLMGLSAFRTLRDTDILSKTAVLLGHIQAKQGEQARLDKVRKLKAEEKAARASRRRPLLKLVKN